MNYIGMECDFCHRRFEEGDDIVVCPECGTPMHRACFNKQGVCAHEAQHAEGFNWTSPEWEKQQEEKKAAEKVLQDAEEQIKQGSFTGGEYGGYQTYIAGENGEFHPTYRVIGAREKLGDYTVSDFGNAVNQNKKKYLPRFFAMQETGRKASWNWAACFFPIVWAFYRKMYRVGIALALILSILPICFASQIGKYYMEYSRDLSSYLLSASSTEDTEQAEKEDAALSEKYQEKYGTVMQVLSINSYIQMFLSILMGLFGNYLYRRHCEQLLKKAKETCATEEEKETFLKKHGGASVLSLVLGLLVEALLSWGIPLLGVAVGTDLSSLIGGARRS